MTPRPISVHTAAIFLSALIWACSPCSAAPAEGGSAAPEAAAKDAPAPQGAAAGKAVTPGSTPGAAATPAGESKAEKAATCKKVVADLGAGSLSVLESLPEEKRAALLRARPALDVLTCLANAEDKGKYCDPLPEEAKKKCLDQWRLVGQLKDAPKGNAKAQLIHQVCLQGSPKDDCDKLRDAIIAGDAAKCGGLPDGPFRAYCAALTSGDATKCKSLTESEERSRCEAYATDDPGRCAKDSVDCRNMAGSFAKMKKDGLGGVASIDPAAAAAVKGKSACAPLLAELERACVQ
jgi:hypothetical protein